MVGRKARQVKFSFAQHFVGGTPTEAPETVALP
jgi:hypothetical protein